MILFQEKNQLEDNMSILKEEKGKAKDELSAMKEWLIEIKNRKGHRFDWRGW